MSHILFENLIVKYSTRHFFDGFLKLSLHGPKEYLQQYVFCRIKVLLIMLETFKIRLDDALSNLI